MLKHIAVKSPGDNHRFCIMCGQENPHSFGLKFEQDDEGAVHANFTGNNNLQGFEGFLHGGVLSAILDTAMAHCLMHQNIKAFTGELNVRYLEPVLCNSELEITAWIDSSLPPLYHLKSHIKVDGTIVCKGKARFMQKELLSDH